MILDGSFSFIFLSLILGLKFIKYWLNLYYKRFTLKSNVTAEKSIDIAIRLGAAQTVHT